MTNTRPHGYARYKLDGCRCTICRKAVSDYNRKATMETTAGTRVTYIDAEPARTHVRALMAAGIGWRRIAELGNIPAGTVKKLLYGKPGHPPPRRIRPATAAGLLAVQPGHDQLAGGARVDATGTRRRAQALACRGWTLTFQAHHVGMTTSNYAAMLDRPHVCRTTADKVNSLYNRLSMAPQPQGPGPTRVRKLAAANWWMPPLAWDDDTIDDPTAMPVVLPAFGPVLPGADELAVQAFAAGHLTPGALDKATRNETMRRLRAQGHRLPALGKLFGIGKRRASELCHDVAVTA